MVSHQDKPKLDAKARQGEIVIPGGTDGKSLEVQENLADVRSRGGETRREQIGGMISEMGSKGGMSIIDQSGGETATQERVELMNPNT